MTDLFVFNVAKLAVKSIINVAAVYPKPGLITPLTNSALDGNDFVTLVDGTMALFQALVNCGSVGADTESMKPEEVLSILRSSLKIGEGDILQATKGKMKLRGHVFFMGLFSAAAGRLAAQRRILTPAAIILTASSFARGIVERELWGIDSENNNKNNLLTQSQKAYIQYGAEGCRGEADKGFPNVLEAISLLRELEATHSHLSFREHAAHVLINTMANLEDACLIYHGGISELLKVQNEAKKIINIGGMLSLEGINAIIDLDKKFSSEGFSPRASALILSSAVFVIGISKLKMNRTGYED